MCNMPGNHRMSARERHSPVWDIRRDDTPRTMEIAREQGSPESLKARILYLRATFLEIYRLTESLPDSETKAEIRSRITNELATIETTLIQ